MFELAHRLVGIYKTSNCTKSIAIDNKDLRTQAVPKNRLGKSPSKSMRSPEKSTRMIAGVPATPLPGVRGGSVIAGTPGTVRGTSMVPPTPSTIVG